MLAAWLLPLPAPAGMALFDAEQNRITISGYAEETPATLDDLLAADKAGGWDRVSHAAETDTYTVKASLWIGTNTDWGTFFQIGRTNHPRETLVLHGDLTVSPPRNMGRRVEHWRDYAGERYDGYYRVSNRLTLGAAGRPDIRPTVKMACARRNEFALRVLVDPMPADSKERWYVPMGELFMFNAVLTAATPDTNHTYAAAITLSHAGINYCLQNSTIAWWDGNLFGMTYYVATRGMTADDRTMRGMIFENGSRADGNFEATDCVFRNLAVARLNGGATRCVFENNRVNFLMTAGHIGIMLTDCIIGPSAQPMLLPRSTRDEQWLRKNSVYKPISDLNLVKNPGVVERVSLPVKVVDQHGRPMAGAVVMLDCPADTEGWAVVRPLAITVADGLTPADGARALVITKRELRPTDDPEAPESITYVYRLTVIADGFKKHQAIFDSAGEIPRPMEVTLHVE